ncbi:hypothetical protein ACKKBG_A08910 [Auxenochlorella protothecoides x Auxenochlorella symbiontica]
MDGFIHLFASQILSRGLTFGLNLLSARSLTPQAYGVVAIQLHLLNTTLLFLSREGFRRGCLRIDARKPGSVLATSALCIPLGAVFSALSIWLLVQRRPGDVVWHQALQLQGLAVVVELLSEPLYVLATVRKQYSLRVGVEAGAQLAKSVLIAGLLARPDADPAVAFSLGQLAYAGATLLCYAAWGCSLRGVLGGAGSAEARAGAPAGLKAAPSPEQRAADQAATDTRPGLDLPALQLSGLFGVQAVGKLVLAEGSKFTLAALQSSYDQGVLGLVTNLGSLLVRTVFQPFEEAAFLAFSRAAAGVARDGGDGVAEGRGDGGAEPGDAASGADDRGGPGRDPSATARPAAARTPHPACHLLPPLTRCIVTFALVAAAFAPAYAHLALLLGYGRVWAASPAPGVLGAYAASLPLLAANGVLEACVHGCAGRRQLARANAALAALSVAHVAALLALTAALGTLGTLAADAVNMAGRVLYCLAWVRRELGVAPAGLWPRAGTLRALAVAALATSAARLLLMPESSGLLAAGRRYLGPGPRATLDALLMATGEYSFLARAALHVALGGTALAAVVAAALAHEGDALRQLRALRKGAKSD